jgi:uncharacterized protein (DUF3820 family)
MSNSVIDFEAIKDLEFEALKGEINPMRNYVITLGQSDNSKGVLFVLYSYLRKCTSPHVNPANYLGNLGGDIETAVKNARKRVPRFQINIEEWETVAKRLSNNTMPFGKYKGMPIEDIFDKDEQYLLWVANSDSINYIKSEGCVSLIREYSAIAKENITQANKAKSTSKALPIEEKTSEKELTLYSFFVKTNEFGDAWNVAKFKDAEGNKYVHQGNSKKITKELENTKIILKCRVVGNYEAMGIIFNKLKLRN